MPLIFIACTGNHAGQSLITWSLARRLTEKGLKVGFLKPFATRPALQSGLATDHDALLFKQVLNLPEPLIQICPFPQPVQLWGEPNPQKLLADFKALALSMLLKYDVLLVMGSLHVFFDDTAFPLPDMAFISELQAEVILIDRFQKISKSIYSILSIASLLKEKVKGIIVNRVNLTAMHDVRERVFLNLQARGAPMAALIPEDPYLSCRTLGEVKEILDGQFLTREQNLGQTVGGLTVGSGDLRDELMLFNRVYNKIILLKPSKPGREDQTPFKPRPIVGILLTNNRQVPPPILKAAENLGVPLLLIKEDTFQALEHLQNNPPYLSPNDEAKMQYITGFLDRDNALENLLAAFNLGKA